MLRQRLRRNGATEFVRKLRPWRFVSRRSALAQRDAGVERAALRGASKVLVFDIRVLLSTEAGGTGLNLQCASYVVRLDLPWNPGRLDQRTARVHRMEQTHGVSVIYLCAERGIERAIEKTLAGKRAVRSAALDGGSSVETLEAPSFATFLSEMQDIFEELAEADGGVDEVTDEADAAVDDPFVVEAQASPPAERSESNGVDSSLQSPAPHAATPALVGTTGPPTPGPHGSISAPSGRVGASHALNRLALARVVLDAGFPADAVKAAYEALAAAIGGLLNEAPPNHATLVAAIFKQLLPAGRLPSGAHATLARLHDLTLLEAHGVEVDATLARAAVAEVGEWLARFGSA